VNIWGFFNPIVMQPVFLQIKNTPTSSWWKIYSTTLLSGYVPSSHSLVVQGRECAADFTKDLLTSVFNNMSDLVAEVWWLCVQSQQVWRTNLVFLFFLFLIYDNAVKVAGFCGLHQTPHFSTSHVWSISAIIVSTKAYSECSASEEQSKREKSLVLHLLAET
jgi:hypothetical protein